MISRRKCLEEKGITISDDGSLAGVQTLMRRISNQQSIACLERATGIAEACLVVSENGIALTDDGSLAGVQTLMRDIAKNDKIRARSEISDRALICDRLRSRSAYQLVNEVNKMADSIVPSILKSYNGKLIRINPNTRYTCLTDMAKATGKLVADWIRLDSTSAYLSLFSSSMGYPIEELLHVGDGSTGTWAHPKIAIRFAQWCSAEFAIQVDFWIDELLTTGKVEIEQDRQKLERNLLPTPGLKKLKAESIESLSVNYPPLIYSPSGS